MIGEKPSSAQSSDMNGLERAGLGGIGARLARWVFPCRPEERFALRTSFLCHFLILTSYYVIRPIRDEMGVAGGVANLPWMFTATLLAMLAANGLFSAIVARFSRRRFIPLAYRFFVLNLFAFFLLWKMASGSGWQIWVGRVFYVWTSVFNLFVVSVFWALMTDVFNTEQGKRLFGFVSVGGTLGAIVGASLTAWLVSRLGAATLLLISAGLLELAARCIGRFPAQTWVFEGAFLPRIAAERPIGGMVWSGITHEFRSPYLLGISGYMLLYSITSTILYFQQADLAAHHFHGSAARTAFFAQLDLAVNVLTIFVQCFFTSQLLRRLGIGLTLAMPPVISVVGFAALGFSPLISVFVVFQTLRRAANFSVSRPAREVLFTVLSREDKYKAKSFLDTFIYRAGDQIGAWSYPVVASLGLGLAGTSFVASPLAAIWCILSFWLGKKHLIQLRRSQLGAQDPPTSNNLPLSLPQHDPG
jgi:AAA family ATP:ADP antiporter